MLLCDLKFDPKKSEKLRKNPKRSIGFEEAQEIWTHPYYLDCRSDMPEQFRATGWVKGELYSVIFRAKTLGRKLLSPGTRSLPNRLQSGPTVGRTFLATLPT